MGFPTRGLAYRLSLYLTAAVAVFLGFFGVWTARTTRSHLEQTVIDSADRNCDVIRRSTRSFMFRNERREIFEIIQAIGEQPALDRIRIYDREGGIRYSTHSEEVGSEVDKTAEACIHCHRGDAPMPEIPQSQRFRIFRNPDGHRTLGMIAPIQNEPECSNASCHVHPPSQRILGVLDVQMSLASIDRDLGRRTRQMVLDAIIVLAGLVLFSVILLFQLVHRPVKRLILGTKKIAEGDLSHRIPVRSHDELADLAQSFNSMTVQLAEAREQSQAWARTLEQRVEEKSRALERVQEEALQMEKMVSMGKLAAIVAHEINNPLAGIRTYARLLLKRSARRGPVAGQDQAGVAESEEILSQIETEATRCGEIVKNLLQFSRPSKPRVEAIDLNDLVRGSVRLVQHQIDLKGLRSELELADGLPPIVCDPQQIRQAMIAVLINACEAMTGEGLLSVSTRPDAGGGVVVSIADTGPGIDPETRKHIFEPFYTTKEGGGGLGLAVVYGIIRSHGGKVDVESAPGEGATFRFHLPSRPPEASLEAEVAE
jgi:two-component system, NtrC family, sensor kinase